MDSDRHCATAAAFKDDVAWVIWTRSKHQRGCSYIDESYAHAHVSTIDEMVNSSIFPAPSTIIQRQADPTIKAWMIFREGVKPAWEDDRNCRGGHLQVQFNTIDALAVVDDVHTGILISLFNGSISPCHSITGYLVVKKGAKNRKHCMGVSIELWFTEIDDENLHALINSFHKAMKTLPNLWHLAKPPWSFTKKIFHNQEGPGQRGKTKDAAIKHVAVAADDVARNALLVTNAPAAANCIETSNSNFEDERESEQQSKPSRAKNADTFTCCVHWSGSCTNKYASLRREPQHACCTHWVCG